MSKTKGKNKIVEELLEEALVPADEQPYKIPENWVWTKMGEIGDYINGRAFKSNEWSTFGRPIIRIQNLTKSNNSEPNYFNGKVDEKHVVNSGDFLISWSATLGAYIWDGPEAVLNQHIFKVKSKINKKFHFYFTKTLINEMYSKTHGSGMVHVTKANFEELKIPLPPCQEQTRIVDKIESLYKKINEAQALINEAKESFELRRTAILDKAFRGELTREWRENCTNSTNADEWIKEIASKRNKPKKIVNQLDRKFIEKLYALPRGWKWVVLGDLVESLTYGTSEKTNDNNNGVPVLRMGNITSDGEFNLNNLKYLSKDSSSRKGLELEAYDILFNRTNSYELVGKSGLINDSIAGIMTYASYLIRLRLVDKELLGEYICNFINGHFGRTMLLSMVTQQVGQANINSQKLASIFIPLPPKEELEVLIKILKSLIQKNNETDNFVDLEKGIINLKQSILQKAFRGELGTTDLKEESAVDILKNNNKKIRTSFERINQLTNDDSIQKLRNLGNVLKGR